MDLKFFLGANSARGFYSLYDGFPGHGAFLHIIKGGPGSGKSGFMKRIRAEAQARGMDTVSILCSGDPDSLDGLFIPELREAWADGTAPHVLEPEPFGSDADYVNLGQFCRLPIPEKERARIRELTRAYRQKYAAAYQLLSAAGALAAGEEGIDEAVCREEELAGRTVLERLPDCVGTGCDQRHCFLSAVTCQGVKKLDETIYALCKQIYVLRGGPEVLARLAELAERKAARMILCRNPLRPEELEAVLLPEQYIAFVRSGAPLPVPAGERALSRQTLALATEELAAAKALHDRLEAVYRPFMDFGALTAYTDACVAGLFK